MAIHAGRDHVWLLLPQFSLDHFAVDKFDLGVTVGASFRDVLFGNGRAGVRVRQNKVCSVTASADRRNNQPTTEQSLAMNAIHVIAQDVGLWDLMCQMDRGTFAVAISAQAGNLHGRSGRPKRRRTQHIMRTMAGLAEGSQAIAALSGLPMKTLSVLRLLGRMTGPAIHRR
jgi:hypothetical protein